MEVMFSRASHLLVSYDKSCIPCHKMIVNDFEISFVMKQRQRRPCAARCVRSIIIIIIIIITHGRGHESLHGGDVLEGERHAGRVADGRQQQVQVGRHHQNVVHRHSHPVCTPNHTVEIIRAPPVTP
jgi:hypothetical protein